MLLSRRYVSVWANASSAGLNLWVWYASPAPLNPGIGQLCPLPLRWAVCVHPEGPDRVFWPFTSGRKMKPSLPCKCLTPLNPWRHRRRTRTVVENLMKILIFQALVKEIDIWKILKVGWMCCWLYYLFIGKLKQTYYSWIF